MVSRSDHDAETVAIRSLRARLIVLWILSFCASIAVGGLLIELSRSSTQAQIGRAAAVIAHACDLIHARFGFYATDWTGPVPAFTDSRLRSDLTAVVSVALANQEGVEGGIWQADGGSLAYAYPTYEGSGPKTDLPAAEQDQIQAVNRQAARDEQPVDWKTIARAQTLLLHACPLPGPISGLTAWTMTRVQTAPGLQPLQLGLGVLLGLMTLLTIWISRTLLIWGRHIGAIETILAGSVGVPTVPRTGERELDRVIDALNDAGLRLSAAYRESEVMTVRVARAERLAGLGRVAAGVAHEIRNPLAAARLQGENALAGDDARRRSAILSMLGQIDRLDALTAELLAVTQRTEPHQVATDIRAFVDEAAARHLPAAQARQVALTTQACDGTCDIDPAMVHRILDNLIANAIRHSRLGGSVMLSTTIETGQLAFAVEDDGEGVPDSIAESLFEPFVTGRPDGTGLGLAIARELADAHGGRLVLRRASGTVPAQRNDHSHRDKSLTGALFVLELPCQPS